MQAFEGFVRKRPTVGSSHLGGFSRMVAELSNVVAVADLSADVPTAVLAALLEDERVLRQVGPFKKVMLD